MEEEDLVTAAVVRKVPGHADSRAWVMVRSGPERLVILTLAKAGFSLIDLVRSPITGPRILIYHQIGAGHGHQLDVRVDDFRRHLDWIRDSGGRVVPLERAISGTEDDPTRTYVLTFDDGYRDMYLSAFPVLKERGLPFTLYLTTGPTETGKGLAPDRPSDPLTWGQVEEMLASGLMTLGAHTHTHPDFRTAGSQQVAEDLEMSDHLIEQRTGARPAHFAYPWGYSAPGAEPLVRQRYSSAVLGGAVSAQSDDDPHRIHRIPIQLSDGVRFFRHKARRGQRTEELVRRLVSGYRGP